MNPTTVSRPYARLAKGLGIDTSLKNMRHYNATELIMADVNLKTVAGRLGHGGGGTTTLRVYIAWHSEADQRAAGPIYRENATTAHRRRSRQASGTRSAPRLDR
jgi:hypothetical protein